MNPSEYRSKIAKQLIQYAQDKSEAYVQENNIEGGYYAFLSGVLIGIVEGLVLDMDDRGVEKIITCYLDKTKFTEVYK